MASSILPRVCPYCQQIIPPSPKYLRIPMEGNRYGHLVVQHFAQIKPPNNYLWCCLCDCGTNKILRATLLRKGVTQSCGCFQKESVRQRATTHGYHSTSTYRCWSHMLERCRNPNNANYPNYGGRGIVVCERWQHSFQNFLTDMGERPRGLTLERIDNNGGYTPENCCWVSPFMQSRNRRNTRLLTFNEETHCLKDWEAITGILATTISKRIDVGWSLQDALTKPSQKKKR